MQTAVNSLRYITLIFVFIEFVAVFNIALIPNAQGGVAGFTRCYCSWHTHNEIYYGIVFIMWVSVICLVAFLVGNSLTCLFLNRIIFLYLSMLLPRVRLRVQDVILAPVKRDILFGLSGCPSVCLSGTLLISFYARNSYIFYHTNKTYSIWNLVVWSVS